MARFEVTGLDDLIERMKQKEVSLRGECADKMLLAGAEVVREAWRASAERHGLRDTGAMIDSIGYAQSPSTVGDVRSIDIYPQGVDSTGQRNAEKAFIINYRKKPGAKGKGWVEEADRDCDGTVLDAMERVFDEWISK